MTPLEKAIVQSGDNSKRVMLAQATIEGVRVEGIGTNLAVLKVYYISFKGGYNMDEVSSFVLLLSKQYVVWQCLTRLVWLLLQVDWSFLVVFFYLFPRIAFSFDNFYHMASIGSSMGGALKISHFLCDCFIHYLQVLFSLPYYCWHNCFY